MELVRQKNVATIITFPLVDADGDAVTGATGLDSNRDEWSDGGAPGGFTACTNEASEIEATGAYYLSLAQAEMNYDYIIIYIASNEAKTQWILIRTIVGDPLLLATTTSTDAIKGDTAAILIDTDTLEADLKTYLDAIESNLETDIEANDTLIDTAITDIAAVKSDTAAILIDTDTMEADLKTEIDANETKIDALQSDLTAVKGKTDNLPADPASETNVNANETKIDAVKADTAAVLIDTDTIEADLKTYLDAIETNLEGDIEANDTLIDTAITDIAAVKADTAAILIDTDTMEADLKTEIDANETKIDTLQTDLTAVKGKTDNLPADPASETNVNANETKIDTVKSDTAAILIDTDTLEADLITEIDANETKIDTIIAKTDNLPGDPASETNVNANETKIDAVKVDTAAILIDTDTMEADLKTYMDTKETNINNNVNDNETKIDTAITDIGNLNDLESADIQTVLENNDLDHLIKVAHPTGDPVVNSLMDLVMNKDGTQTFARVDDSLQGISEGAAGGGASAQEVWEYAGGDRTLTTPADYKADVSALALEATVQAIKALTDNLPADTKLELIKLKGVGGIWLVAEYHHDANNDNDYIEFWQYGNQTDFDNETKANAINKWRQDITYTANLPQKSKWNKVT